MPIARRNARSGYPLLGRFRKGAPKPESGNKPGTDLDYFRVEFEPQFAFLQEAFTDLYGEQPNKIENIILLGHDPDSVFPNSFKQHNQRGDVVRECDGTHQTRWLGDDFAYHRDLKPCLAKETAPCEFCKQEGILFFGIPAFIFSTGYRGYFMMTTHSWNDINSIYNTIANAYEDVGLLNGLTFDLERVIDKVNHGKQTKQSDGSYAITGRMSSDKSLVKLTPTAETTRKYLLPAMTNAVQIALPDGLESSLMLDSGNTETESDLPQIDWFEGLCEWALEQLGIQASEVMEALERDFDLFEDAGKHYSSATKSEGLACVISYFNGYAIGEVHKWFTSGNLDKRFNELFPICETICSKGE